MSERDIKISGSFQDDITPKLKKLSDELTGFTRRFQGIQRSLGVLAKGMDTLTESTDNLTTLFRDQEEQIRQNTNLLNDYARAARRVGNIRPTATTSPNQPSPTDLDVSRGSSGIRTMIAGAAIGGLTLAVSNLVSSISGAIVGTFTRGFQLLTSHLTAALDFFRAGLAERIGDEMSDVKAAGGAFTASQRMENPIFKTLKEAEEQSKETNRYLAQLAGSLPGSTQEYVQVSKQIADGIYGLFPQDKENVITLAEKIAAENGELISKVNNEQTLKDVAKILIGELTKVTVLAGLGGESGGAYGLPALTEKMLTQQNVSLASLMQYTSISGDPLIKSALERNIDKITATQANTAERYESLLNMFQEIITPELIMRYQRTVSGVVEAFRTSIFDPDVGLLGLGRPIEFLSTVYDDFGNAVIESGSVVKENLAIFDYFKDIFFNLAWVFMPIIEASSKLLDPFLELGKRLSGIREVTMKFQSNFESYRQGLTEMAEGMEGETQGKFLSTVGLRASLATINNTLFNAGIIAKEEAARVGRLLKATDTDYPDFLNILLSQVGQILSSESVYRGAGKALGSFFKMLADIVTGFLTPLKDSAFVNGFIEEFRSAGGSQAIKDFFNGVFNLLVNAMWSLIKNFPTQTALIGFFVIFLPALVSALFTGIISIIPQLFGALFVGKSGAAFSFSGLSKSFLGLSKFLSKWGGPLILALFGIIDVINRVMNGQDIGQAIGAALITVLGAALGTILGLAIAPFLGPLAVLAPALGVAGGALGGMLGGQLANMIFPQAATATPTSATLELPENFYSLPPEIQGQWYKEQEALTTRPQYGPKLPTGPNLEPVDSILGEKAPLWQRIWTGFSKGIARLLGWIVGGITGGVIGAIAGLNWLSGKIHNFLWYVFITVPWKLLSSSDFRVNVSGAISNWLHSIRDEFLKGIANVVGEENIKRFFPEYGLTLEERLQNRAADRELLDAARARWHEQFQKTGTEDDDRQWRNPAGAAYKGSGTDSFMSLPRAIATEIKNKPPGSNLVIANSSELIIPTKSAANGNGDVAAIVNPLHNISSHTLATRNNTGNAITYLNNLITKSNENRGEIASLSRLNTSGFNILSSLMFRVGSTLESGIRVEVTNTPTVKMSFEMGEMGPIGGGIGNFPKTSGFGQRNGSHHAGNDYAMPVGTRLAIGVPGRVVGAGWWGGYGLAMDILSPTGMVYRFAHLSRFLAPVGATLPPNTPFALSGNTGRSTGPHLHFEAKPGGGTPINPDPFASVIRANFAGMGISEVMGGPVGQELSRMPYGSDLVVGNSSEIMMKPGQTANLISSSVRAGVESSGSITISGMTININGSEKSGKELADEIAAHILGAIESANYSTVI